MPQEALPDLEHCVSSMGKTRDLDGTVDRVAPPPDEMWPILYCLKRKCEDENIELNSIFEEGGGTHFGVMKMQQFESTLTVNFSRFQFTEDTLQRIRSHYGVGYKNKRDGNRESIAWKDFCEDVGDAMDTTNGKADALAATRGAVLDLKNLI